MSSIQLARFLFKFHLATCYLNKKKLFNLNLNSSVSFDDSFSISCEITFHLYVLSNSSFKIDSLMNWCDIS